MALTYYIIATQAQTQARKYEALLDGIVKEISVSDGIYDPTNCGTKEEFDKMLNKQGIRVDAMRAIDEVALVKPEKQLRDKTK